MENKFLDERRKKISTRPQGGWKLGQKRIMKGKLRVEREKEVENNIKKQVKKLLGEIKG